MTIDEMIAVLKAEKEGKTIQFKRNDCKYQEWEDCHNGPLWNFCNYDYRVKPEPMEALLWFDKNGHHFTTLNLSEKECASYKRGGYLPRKFREVIE